MEAGWQGQGHQNGLLAAGQQGLPLWFQAGMRGMSIDEIKTVKKEAKEADDEE